MRSLMSISLPPRHGTAVKSQLPTQELMSVQHDHVIDELVTLASKYASFPARYVRDGSISRTGKIMIFSTNPEDKFFRFSNELRRLQSVVTKPLDEPVLLDNYPVLQGETYVVDGKVKIFGHGLNMTVADWKKLPGSKGAREVRQYDAVGRKLRTPPADAPRQPFLRNNQRTSNKIKRVG